MNWFVERPRCDLCGSEDILVKKNHERSYTFICTDKDCGYKSHATTPPEPRLRGWFLLHVALVLILVGIIIWQAL